MNDYIDAMVEKALQRINSLSIDELEKEFRSYGLSTIRRKEVQFYTPVKVAAFTYINVNKISGADSLANDEFCYSGDYDYKNAA